MTAGTHRHLDRKIALACIALGLERMWAALLWPVIVLGLLASLVISGLLPQVPPLSRYGVLGLFLLVYFWSMRAAFRVNWPRRDEAIRHLEVSAALAHRPLSTLNDRLADSEADQRTAMLWQEHQLRQLRAVGGLAVARPRSFWRDLDPRALRLPVALALIASFFLGQGDPRANLAETLRPGSVAEAKIVTLDAWLKPPAYTGKPPVVLTSAATIERLKAEPDIVVPENSTLVLRVNGGVAPELGFFELGDSPELKPVTGLDPKARTGDGLYQSETKIARPVLVRLSDGGRELVSWRVTVIPDTPPTVVWAKEPETDALGALTAFWRLTDDYGVTGLSSEISLSDEQEDGLGFEANGVFLYDAPKFPVGLRKASPKTEDGKATADLTAHPWAGFMVDLVLEARDAAGQITQSDVKRIKLPERLFTKPLARALIEQRKDLIRDPENSADVSKMLQAILAYPKELIENSGTHIAIATVVSRIDNALDADDIRFAVDALWQIAVNVEDGTLADARAELQALRDALERALAEGAPPEKIQELMNKLRAAMDRYLEQMTAEAIKRMQNGQMQRQQQQQGQQISPQDLQKMLDMIEKLSKSGANEAARQMLSQLDQILRNLQMGQPQQGQQGENPLSEMLDQLSEMMRRQQGLMDDTQRMQDGGDGEPQQQGQNGQPLSPDGLGDRQQGISEMLQQMLDQLGQQGLQGPPSLGEAGRSMNEAEGSLRQGDREGALGQEGEALSKLREGAQGLVQQMIQQGQGEQGSQGEHGQARGDDVDPLGRPMPNRAEDFGPERNMLPSELAIRRAQEILEMLRSRANSPDMPRLERDYIERLLRGLY
jgi:uncharacterized protein (TIGR02302 family)